MLLLINIIFSKNGTYQNSSNTSGASKTGGVSFTLGNQILLLAMIIVRVVQEIINTILVMVIFISSGNADANGHGN